MSNRKIKEFKTVREANSDHLPMPMSINLKETVSKKKNLCFTRKVIPNTKEIKGLLQNKNCPSVIDIEATIKISQKKLSLKQLYQKRSKTM